MKKKKSLMAGLVFSAGLVLAACGDTTETVEEVEVVEEKPEVVVEPKELTQVSFESYASNITGSTFIESIVLNGTTGSIKYFDSFEAYIAQNGESKLTQESYTSYFEGDTIEKLFVSESVRLLREFPTLETIEITLPYNNVTHYINLSRSEVNDYLGFKVEELSSSDDSWTSKFVDPIVYNDTERKAFYEKFVETK